MTRTVMMSTEKNAHVHSALSNGNQTVTFTPARAFSAGEVVLLNLSHDLVAADASPLRSAGYAFQFTVGVHPGSRTFTFLNVLSNRTGGPGGPQTRIYGAQATDLNHDGYLDLATVNEVSGDVRVTLNTADGQGGYTPFLTPEGIALESSPNEQADFDNDGETDGCFSAANGQAVTILMGNGDGTYDHGQTINLSGAPHGMSMAQFALRWILMFDAVTCAIPGAKRPSQVEENVAAADLPSLSEETMQKVNQIYEQRIRPLVHQYW